MQDLDPKLRDEIDQSFRSAREALNNGSVDVAIDRALAAWERLPEPRFEWDVSKSYVYALALIYRDSGLFSNALELMQALFASGTVREYQDRPRFVLGTIYYEAGDMENARRWLGEANRISKGRCFREEPEKYRKVIAM